MSRKPDPAAPIDPRSDALVLFYSGGPTPRDVPARDLHGGDLSRIAYARAHLDLVEGLPSAPTPRQLVELAAELLASGSFVTEPTPQAPAEPEKEMSIVPSGSPSAP